MPVSLVNCVNSGDRVRPGMDRARERDHGVVFPGQDRACLGGLGPDGRRSRCDRRVGQARLNLA
jgi:hypothetical protein